MEAADRQTTGEELNRLLSDEELGRLQLTTLQYYFHESNPVNGLIRDKTDPRAPSSIAAIGLALATVPVLVERGVIFPRVRRGARAEAAPLLPRQPARAASRTPPATRASTTTSST